LSNLGWTPLLGALATYGKLAQREMCMLVGMPLTTPPRRSATLESARCRPYGSGMDTSAVLDHPLPASWSVAAGRAAYLAENGFSVMAYDAPTTEAARLFGVRFSVPNTPRHRWALLRHDLHHVATGYGTDYTGEAEISAWELRSGIRALGLYTGSIVLSVALLGLLIAPLRTLRAFLAGGRAQSLFRHGGLPYDALLSLSIAELRAYLNLPEQGLCDRPRRLSALASAPQSYSGG
jgi:hypothetical protein